MCSSESDEAIQEGEEQTVFQQDNETVDVETLFIVRVELGVFVPREDIVPAQVRFDKD